MRLAILIVVALVALAAPAAADLRWGVHLGGGLEGGLISGEPRPDGVMEAGTTVEALLPGRNWGFGASAEVVGRLTRAIDAREELKLDLSWRWATSNRRVRGGVGGGLRVLTLDGAESPAQSVTGIDLIRLDADVALARWQPVGAPSLGVDFYFSWTFGCYSDSYREMPVGDMTAPSRAVRCGDTITTTYVGGIRTSVSWR